MKFLFLILLMSISTLVFGQKGDIFIGVDVGYTTADIINRPFIDGGSSISPLPASPSSLYDEERSILVGISGEYFFAKSWAVRSKLQYYKTAHVRVEGLGTFVSAGNPIREFEEFNADRYERQSLSIPIQLMFSFDGNRFRGQVALGPMYSLALSDEFQQDIFSTSDVSNIGYALNLIFSYAIVPDSTFLYIDSGYLSSGRFEGENIKNRTISLGIKYKL